MLEELQRRNYSRNSDRSSVADISFLTARASDGATALLPRRYCSRARFSLLDIDDYFGSGRTTTSGAISRPARFATDDIDVIGIHWIRNGPAVQVVLGETLFREVRTSLSEPSGLLRLGRLPDRQWRDCLWRRSGARSPGSERRSDNRGGTPAPSLRAGEVTARSAEG
jgi:hypothetical protein